MINRFFNYEDKKELGKWDKLYTLAQFNNLLLREKLSPGHSPG